MGGEKEEEARHRVFVGVWLSAGGVRESVCSKTCLLSPDLKSSRKAIRLAGSPAVPYLELMADIILTPSASPRVAAIAKQQRHPAILRLAVTGRGCSRVQYRLGLAAEIAGTHVAVGPVGVQLIIDRRTDERGVGTE